MVSFYTHYCYCHLGLYDSRPPSLEMIAIDLIDHYGVGPDLKKIQEYVIRTNIAMY